MKQVHDSYETVLQSKDEIRKRFAAYDFRDTVGHPLLLCADFDSLVNSYCLLATHRNDFEIVMEIFKALARLSSESLNIPAILSHTLYAEAERRGEDMYLLSAIGSWGDTQTDDEVLAMTKSVNLDLMAQETASRRKNEG